MNQFAVILPAAGASTRFGRNKLLEVLEGKTVIARSVGAFLARTDVAIVIIAAADEPAIRAGLGELANDRRLQMVPGGSCRAESVKSALAHVPADVEWVAIHDAARPLVSNALIDRVWAAAREHNAAAPAMPVTLTVKLAYGPLPAWAVRTTPRSNLWAMQTPQIVKRKELATAFESCTLPLGQITDDLQLLELANFRAWLVDGEEQNIKITTQLDMAIAKWWLTGRKT